MALFVGLMSGTSIDGIDVALVDIRGESKISLKSWAVFPFPKGFKKRILNASHPAAPPVGEICALNFEIGELFADAVKKLCRKASVPLSDLKAIGSHGQTICHLGRKGTMQIGEPSVIAARTGVTTVADFRPRDIAEGGFGAPLAPYLHYLLFRHPKKNRAVQNIGGIANVTILPKNASPEDVRGFDTGPGNMVIDGVLRELTGDESSYDHGGKIAEKGHVHLRLLKDLMKHPFIRQKPPKTSGREEFGKKFVLDVIRRARALRLSREDLVATVTALTASSIAENYRRFLFPRVIPDEIILGGGGIHNASLMKMLRAELAGIPIRSFDDFGVAADALEAVCFAVLAYETLRGRPSSIPSVTGAKKSAILGKIVRGNP